MIASTTISNKTNIQIGLLVTLLTLVSWAAYRVGTSEERLEAIQKTTIRIEAGMTRNTDVIATTNLRVGVLEMWREVIDQWRADTEQRANEISNRVQRLEERMTRHESTAK